MTVSERTSLASTRMISVALADDHAIIRDGLSAIINTQSDMKLIGEAADGQQAWQLAVTLRPDVMVLDLSMPVMGGIETTERIVKDSPSVRILVLTMHEERGYVARLIRAGAAGFLLKRSAAAELVRAIRVLAGGGAYVDPSLAGNLLVETAQASNSQTLHKYASELSTRERETIQLIARGHTNKEIAAAFELSVKTIESHRANAMAKLGLKNRAALVRMAIDEGWLI